MAWKRHAFVTRLSQDPPSMPVSQRQLSLRTGESMPFKTVTLTCTLLAASTAVWAQDVTGAGATFPAPLYAKWAADYHKATGTKVNYQSVGSGAGLKQIDAKTVDFGASDMPYTDEQLAAKGLVQFPTVIGGVVPVVNIKGIAPGQLKLTGQVLGDIYLGNDNGVYRITGAELAAESPHRVAGRDSAEGFVNLLRRHIAPVDLLKTCLDQWKLTVAAMPGRKPDRARLEKMQELINQQNELEPRRRQPVATYRRFCEILAKRT